MDVLRTLADVARTNGGLVTRAQARVAGISDTALRRATRCGRVARVARGVYAAAATATSAASPETTTRSMRVVLSSMSAAAWWGVDLPTTVRRLHVTAPRNRGRRRDAVAGVRIHRANLGKGDVTVLHGVRVTTPLRTALDIARHEPLGHAVAVVDAFLRKGLLTVDEFVAATAHAQGPGRRRLQLVASLVDPDAGSILESLTRVLLWRHDLRPPHTQYPVRHRRSGWTGRLDFAWPQLRVAVECDGYEFHAAVAPFQKDRRRWTALSRADWRCAVFTWFDVTQDPAYVVAAVTELLAAGRLQVSAHNPAA